MGLLTVSESSTPMASDNNWRKEGQAMWVKAVIWARGSLFGMVALRAAVLPRGDRTSTASEILPHGVRKIELPQGLLKIPCLTVWLRPMGRPDNRGVFRYLRVLSSTVDSPAFFWIDAIASCADFFYL